MKRIIPLIFITLLLFTFAINAQEKFTATLSKNPVSIGERIQVTFTLNTRGSNFRAPDFRGFRILSGPNQSSSMRIVNGVSSQEFSFSYLIEPRKEGTFKISPATITVNGRQLKSNALQVEVMPESQAQKQRREAEENRKQSINEQAEQIISENLFVKLKVNKNNVYQGEQITATYNLYVHPQLNLVNLESDQLPVFNGFWTQEIDIGRLQFEQEILNGVTFRKAVVKKVILFPQRSGELSVDPYGFKFTARLNVNSQRSNDPFESFFGRNYRDFEYSTQTNAAKINVKPLPENAPMSFTGAVGDLKMEAWFDKTESVQNDPFTLKIKISGKGNLQLIEPIVLNLPPGFEAFEPKSSDNINVSASGVNGSKTFEYLIIPRNKGKYNIGPIEFTYFDLSEKKYKTINSELFELTVKEGDGDSGSGFVSGILKEDVELLGSDIRYIKTNTKIEKSKCKFLRSPFFYIISLLPIALFAGLILLRSKQQKENANIALVKNKRANKIAKKRLASANGFMKTDEKNKFYEELTKALWGYASDKLGIPVSELTKDSLSAKMLEFNINDEKVKAFINILDECEFARYAPGKDQGTLENAYNQAVKAITDIEGELK